MHRRVLLSALGSVTLVRTRGAMAQGGPGSGFGQAVAAAHEAAWQAIRAGSGSAVTAAVLAGDRFVFSEALGIADRAHDRPAGRTTRFNIGSVSKMFAAVAILLLVDEGKVALDAPVVRYLTDFTMADPRHRAITVRMLLNHASGLPGSTFFLAYAPVAGTHAMLLDTLRRSTLKHAPGAMSMYCNDGFTLAEMIVERVAGRRYLDFLAERIFAPLGMTHTAASLGEIAADDVAEHYEAKSGRRHPREVVPVYATGGLSSTAEDLCRFGASFLPHGRHLLSPAALGEFLRPQPTPFAGRLRNAQRYDQLGWDYAARVGDGAAQTLVLAKGGNTAVYAANLQVLPEVGMVIAVIASGPASADALTEPILAGLLRDRGQVAAAAVAAVPPPAAEPIPESLDGYAGFYAMETGALKASFDTERRRLILASPAGGPALELTWGAGYFHEAQGARRYYFGSADGLDFMVANIAGLAAYDTLVFQKLPPLARPRTLDVPMQGERWLIRNAPAAVEPFEYTRLIVTSRAYPELPGYVDFDGVRRVERGDLAVIAATTLRDQSDLALVPGEDGPWVRTGAVLRSNARSAPALPPGESSVTIGAAGYNAWRSVARAATLRIDLPTPACRVIVATAEATLHDSRLDPAGPVAVPAGGLVFFAGPPGARFAVNEAARP